MPCRHLSRLSGLLTYVSISGTRGSPMLRGRGRHSNPSMLRSPRLRTYVEPHFVIRHGKTLMSVPVVLDSGPASAPACIQERVVQASHTRHV